MGRFSLSEPVPGLAGSMLGDQAGKRSLPTAAAAIADSDLI